MKVKSRIWIEGDDGLWVAEGRVELMKQIDKLGSLNQAAKSMGMSYRKAWGMIKEINQEGEKELVKLSSGGKGGGGAMLTENGKVLIKMYDSLKEKCQSYLDKEMQTIKKKWNEN